MPATLPVASTKRQAASTFGPMEPAANAWFRNWEGVAAPRGCAAAVPLAVGRHRPVGFGLQGEEPHLRAVAVGDDDGVGLGNGGDRRRSHLNIAQLDCRLQGLPPLQ